MVKDTLENTKKIVWPIIDSYLKDPLYPTQFQINKRYQKVINLYWKINKEYPERKGKYLRPTLVLLISEALGGNITLASKVAAAMQLSEEWILVHDDIEDNSESRRDKPALHKIYGNELAINAGDCLHAIMWKIVCDTKSKEINEEFHTMLMRTILGQGVEQIWTSKKIKNISENSYFFIADSKSGYYSVAGPMRLGAIAAGATEDQINKITEFGLHLGRCFQLVDDILDIEQDKKEGKITLATHRGKEFATNLAIKEREMAKKIFKGKLNFLSRNPARKNLIELIDFIVEREY